MKEETVNQLIATITEALRLTADSQLKLVALERAVAKHDQRLLKAWSEEIVSLGNQRAYEMNLLALSSLKSMLLHE